MDYQDIYNQIEAGIYDSDVVLLKDHLFLIEDLNMGSRDEKASAREQRAMILFYGINRIAYDRGHSSGMHEYLRILVNMFADLVGAVK